MKHLLFLIVALLVVSGSSLMAQKIYDDDIVILFDNDVHGHMEGYAKMAELRKEMLRKTPHVCLVSLGDFSQGGALTSISHGQYAVDAMNLVGYDYIALGNHEFDYGIEQLHQLTNSLTAKTLTFNFCDAKTRKPIFQPYVIRKLSTLKIGFIGCVTPVTKFSDAPDSFVDADGNDLYDFCHGSFYTLLQHYIDEVRAKGVDMVIVLSHLGDVDSSYETSEEAIHKTHGIDIFLDGHAHHVIPERYVPNDRGDLVLLSSTGAHFANMGRLIITTERKCKTDLIPVKEYRKDDPTLLAAIKQFRESLTKLPVIAQSEYDLAGFDEEHNTYDRNCQTNLGQLCADAFRIMGRADIGWINAGGIRNSIHAGNITYKELLDAFPFENQICVCEFSGQQIMDALEYGVSRAPLDNPSFPQVSGLDYTLNTNIKSNILTDASGTFVGIGEGPRRATNVRVLNRKTQQYDPIKPDGRYTISSIDFILLKGGCNGMLSNGKLITNDQMMDTQLIENYLRTYLNGIVDEAYKNYVQR